MLVQPHTGNINADMLALLLTADPDESAVNNYIGAATIAVIKEADKVVAVAAIIIEGRAAELKNIAVSLNCQGQGMAKALIFYMQQLAKESGATSLTVGTGNSSLDQLALYQKCGFRFDSIIPDFFLAYPEPIYENGLRCIDMVILRMEL